MNGWDGALVAAVSAILVFTAGQIVQRFFLEPIQEQQRLIGEVAHALLFYANRGPYGFTQEELNETRDHLRGLAGQLRASIFYIPLYDTVVRLSARVPQKENVLEAATQLVGWSNGLYHERSGPDNSRRRRIIAEKLGITRQIGSLD
jgi:hypothetical protein